MTMTIRPTTPLEQDVFSENHPQINGPQLSTSFMHTSAKGKERAPEGLEQGSNVKATKPTVTFSPHARHHPYKSDARVSTSLRTVSRQGSYIYTPKRPNQDRFETSTDPESPTTPRANEDMTSSTATPKSILKRNRLAPIRVAASVEEGTRGNAEELRQSGRATERPVLQVRDSFTINKDRSNPLGTVHQAEGSSGTRGGAGGFREAEVPSSDNISASDYGEGNVNQNVPGHPGNVRDVNDRDGNGKDSNHSLGVEMVELISTPSTIDSLLDIILNEVHDLLAIEDAYLLLFARLKRSFLLNEDSERTDRTSEQEDERQAVLRAFGANTSDLFRALTRDIKRLVQPATCDTRFLGSSSPISRTEDPLATPSPSPQNAGESDQEETPKPRRQGYSEAEVRERRAAAGVGQAALKVLSFIGYHAELHGHFSEADLTSLLSTTLVIPATAKLNTPNSKRTYAFAIYVLSLLRVPLACLVPIQDKVVRALLNATGEFSAQFWRGSQAKQEGAINGNVKAKIEGYSAIWNACLRYPSIFLSFHKDLVPEIIKGITNPNPQIRSRASAAAGGLAKGKLAWLGDTQRELRDIVQAGKGDDEDDDHWDARKLEAERRWKLAKDTSVESEATTVQQLKRVSKTPYGQEGHRRMLVWDEVEKMLSQTMINDPHWACATWSCLVIMLGDGYINDSQRYKSMQHIILSPLSKIDGPQPSPGRVWLSRFAYDHTVYAIFNYKKQHRISAAGLPIVSFDLDYSLGEKMLGASMSLVSEAWKREYNLIQTKEDASIVTSSLPDGSTSQSWRRLDSDSSQTYLKACGSEVVGIMYGALVAILGDESQEANRDSATERTASHTRIDQLWKAIGPVLESMILVKAVDWIKIEALKLLAALVCPVHSQPQSETNTMQRMEALLHCAYLEGEAANIDIPPKGREQSLLELAQSLAEKRVQPEDLPALPSNWILAKMSNGLGSLFRQCLRSVHSLQDASLVPELTEGDRSETSMPEYLSIIWTGMLSAMAESDAGLVGHDSAQLEVLNTVLDVYGTDAKEFVPLANPPLDPVQQDLIRLGIIQDMVISAIDIVGPGVFSRYNRQISLDPNPKNVTPEIQDGDQAQGLDRSSIAGAILQRLISEPPGSLSSNSSVQRMFFTIFERLMSTLQGGSASKRVLGNLTNAMTTFRLHDQPGVRKRLWIILVERWIEVMKTPKESLSASNNTCRMLVELLVRPYREEWARQSLGSSDSCAELWVRLLQVAVSRSESKGVDAVEGVCDPLAQGLQAVKQHQPDAQMLASQIFAASEILQLAQGVAVLPGSLLDWLSDLLLDASGIGDVACRIDTHRLVSAFASRVMVHQANAAKQALNIQKALVLASISGGAEQIDSESDVCHSLIVAVKLAYESGWIPWETQTVQAWGPTLQMLFRSTSSESRKLYHDFWYASHDKLGSDCFPEEYIDAITESLGLASRMEEAEEPASANQHSPSECDMDDINLEEPQEAEVTATIDSAGYAADVSATLTPSQVLADPQPAVVNKNLKRKTRDEDEASSSGRRLRSYAVKSSQDPASSSPAAKTRRQRKQLRRSQSQTLISETPRASKRNKLRATKSLTISNPHPLDGMDDDCIVVGFTPPSIKTERRLARLAEPTPLPRDGHTDGTVQREARRVEGLTSPSKSAGDDSNEGLADEVPLVELEEEPSLSLLSDTCGKPGTVNVLIIATGTMTCAVVPSMLKAIREDKRAEVQVVATDLALKHFSALDVRRASEGGSHVWTDAQAANCWNEIGDPLLHVELRRWADIVLVAPCDANTLAKIANGIYDNLATSVLRALSPKTPTFLFPAMDSHMYEHPLTPVHTATIRDIIGYEVVGPRLGKRLLEGKGEIGDMTEWREIVGIIRSRTDDIVESKAIRAESGSE